MLFIDNNSIYRKYMLDNADLTADIPGTLRSLFLIYHNDPFMISDTPCGLCRRVFYKVFFLETGAEVIPRLQ